MSNSTSILVDALAIVALTLFMSCIAVWVIVLI